MTSDSKRKNIALELARGAEALDEARLLLAAGKAPGAVSRAYYGAFHHALALLLSAAVEPRSYGGVERLIHREFVRAGKLDADVALRLSRLMKLRQEADYAAEVVLTPEAARAEVESAEIFTSAIEALLRAEGWIG